MLEYKIVQYKRMTIYYDEELTDNRGKKTVKHMQRAETDKELFERITKNLTEFSAEGWSVVTMNNVMPSYSPCEGFVQYSEYFSFLLSREKKQ